MAGPHALRPRRTCIAWLAAGLFGLTAQAHADTARIAVAANFTEAAKEIAKRFERATGHDAILSFGSTGQLYTQITQAAPFDVFLAADHKRPQMALDAGLAVPGTLITYATGKIVLFSKDRDLVTGAETLKLDTFTKIAIANPQTAPYGAAAVEAMKALDVYDALSPKVVRGNNIAQVYQFIETGNAEIGFVALSQIARQQTGSRWIVPTDLYAPITQDAVLLERGSDNAAARTFLTFLNSADANAVKKEFGYGTADEQGH
jgi:molybdate transport system substrate-binding protein